MRAMVAAHPTNPLARFGLANELLKARDLEGAVAELAIYLGVYDDEGNGWLRYAEALESLGRSDEAQEAATRGKAAALRFGHTSLAAEFDDRGY